MTTKATNYRSSYIPVAQTSEIKDRDGKLQKIQKESKWIKLIPFCILIPTATSVAILILHLQQYKDTGSLYHWSITNRSLVQVIVHILSSALALLWSYPMCTLINQSTRYRITRENVSLNKLKLWSAMTQGRPDFTLPWSLMFATLAFLTLTYIPATLWAGALTPSVTQKLVLGIPLPVPGSGPHGNYSYLTEKCWEAQQNNGTFRNCLQVPQAANLLRSVAMASSSRNTSVRHSKWDNTGLQYIGPSFGVGASAGLADLQIRELVNVQNYDYHEVGFQTEVQCIYNESSISEYTLVQEASSGYIPNMYLAKAALPNSNWTQISEGNFTSIVGYEYHVQSAFENPGTIVTQFKRGATREDRRYVFAMLAGHNYKHLDKVQCEITWQPTDFLVSVTLVNRTVTVSPTESATASDLDPTSTLRNHVLDSLRLSEVLTSLLTSTIGDSFNENIDNTLAQLEIEGTDNPRYRPAVLTSVAESVRSVIEDSLVSLGSAALTRANATSTVEATATVSAVQIGSKPFIWAAFLINCLGLIVASVGFLLLWKADVPLFDYCNLGSVVFGILQRVLVLTYEAGAVTESGARLWNGDSRDDRIDTIMARLEFRDLGDE